MCLLGTVVRFDLRYFMFMYWFVFILLSFFFSFQLKPSREVTSPPPLIMWDWGVMFSSKSLFSFFRTTPPDCEFSTIQSLVYKEYCLKIHLNRCFCICVPPPPRLGFFTIQSLVYKNYCLKFTTCNIFNQSILDR